MKDILLRMWDFLKINDFPTFLETLRVLDWRDVLKSAYTWLIGLPLLVLLIWTRRFKILIGLVSMMAFLLLLQFTLPPAGEQIPLSGMLTFIGGAFAIIAINLYFLFIRD